MMRRPELPAAEPGAFMGKVVVLDQSKRRIRELNDALRCQMAGGEWHLSPGVRCLPSAVLLQAIADMQAFAAFTPHNDPGREHAFGLIVAGKAVLTWRIDYYDLDCCFPAPDPTDDQLTRRILTLSLAGEY